jgi:hypothetical protein
MPAAMVVLVFSVGDHDPCLGQGPEEVDVQAFVAELAVERLDVAVAPRLARWDERQTNRFPGQSRSAAQANSGPLSLRNMAG